eukprot:TRINITY_DN62928_c0_g1_i1.p1 TRINITY_DN62928_c0_g1~~TRINITY_DN62928_c0_g1_i1.p1  ORF type:complete len:226 (+),score=48.62 TRINITY_DN62928_c0_g1_i1:36-713(+)
METTRKKRPLPRPATPLIETSSEKRQATAKEAPAAALASLLVNPSATGSLDGAASRSSGRDEKSEGKYKKAYLDLQQRFREELSQEKKKRYALYTSWKETRCRQTEATAALYETWVPTQNPLAVGDAVWYRRNRRTPQAAASDSVIAAEITAVVEEGKWYQLSQRGHVIKSKAAAQCLRLRRAEPSEEARLQFQGNQVMPCGPWSPTEAGYSPGSIPPSVPYLPF